MWSDIDIFLVRHPTIAVQRASEGYASWIFAVKTGGVFFLAGKLCLRMRNMPPSNIAPATLGLEDEYLFWQGLLADATVC